IWIILIGGGLGALVYIVAEVLPDVTIVVNSLEGISRRRRITYLERLIVDNPAVGNLEELADLLLDEGQFARAKELYDTVIAKSRDDSLDPFYRRGIAEIELGDFTAALADLDCVVAKDPKYDFHRALGLLAHAHSRAGDLAQAEALFTRATDISTL